MGGVDDTLTRIGIFYDGNYFSHVSNYYQYYHERRARLSISGLHNFVRDKVAQAENNDTRYCQIVDAHYFRGRLRASEAEDRDLLYKERVFDDVLVREGVTTHYLPLARDGEKGIDVWLALEAYELAIYKRFNVTVLVTCDGDFLPLIRKLNTLGSRVMLLGWDFKFADQNGFERETRTAQVLLDEVTYPIMMHQVIDDRAKRNDPLINGLFLPRRDAVPVLVRPPFAASPASVAPAPVGVAPAPVTANGTTVYTGTIQSLKTGFGFITPDQTGPNMFFFHLDVLERDFLDLVIGDRVQYVTGQNDRGPCAKQVRVLSDNKPRDALIPFPGSEPEDVDPS